MYQSCLSLRKCVSGNDAQLDYTLRETEIRRQTKLFHSLRQQDLLEGKESKKCLCLEESGCGKILNYKVIISFFKLDKEVQKMHQLKSSLTDPNKYLTFVKPNSYY